MSTRVLWRGNTGRHDWRQGAPLVRLLSETARLGLTGRAATVEAAGSNPAPILAAPPGEGLARAILTVPPSSRGAVEILVGGTDPAPWELFWNVYPFDDRTGELDGFNSVWLTFDRSRVPDRAASDALLAAFVATCAADTEYAVVHPYTHWSSLSERRYDVPVTINLQFKGVFWANFLGPGHADAFDPVVIAGLGAHLMRWVEGPGLFIVATPDLASSDDPASEPELLRLTQGFREALRPESGWRKE